MNKIKVLTLIFCGFCGTLWAQDSTQDSITLYQFSIDEILSLPVQNQLSLAGLSEIDISTASRYAEKASKAPATVIVITREQIERRNYQALYEVLEDMPDMQIGKKVGNADDGGYYMATVRGVIGQANLLILLDGMRISSPAGDPLVIMENYPVQSAQQIEIMYGPASALYGADAVSGVVNIISRRATKKFQAEGSSNYGMYGATNHQLWISKKFRKINFSAYGQIYADNQPDITKFYADTLLDKTGLQTGTFPTRFGNMTPKRPVSPEFAAPIFAYNWGLNLDTENFSFRVMRSYGQTSNAYPMSMRHSIYNKEVILGQHLFAGSATYTTSFGKTLSSSSFMASEYEMDPETSFRSAFGDMEIVYKYAYGRMIQLEQQFAFQLSKKLIWSVGGFYQSFFSMPKGDDFESPIDRNNPIGGVIYGSRAPLNPEGIKANMVMLRFTNFGGFSQLNYTPNAIFSLTLGSRYDYNSRFGQTINPRVGLVITPSPSTTFKVLYGSAFLAPSPHNSFQEFGTFVTFDEGETYTSFYRYLQNPNLRPVIMHSFEVGYKQFIGKNFSISLHPYYSILTDLIVSVPDASTLNLHKGKSYGWDVGFIEIPINQGKQTNYGTSLQLDYLKVFKKGKIHLWSSVSLLDGTIRENIDGELKNVPIYGHTPFQWRVGVAGQYGKFDVSIRVLKSGKQYIQGFANDLYTERQSYAGFWYGTASVNYQIAKFLTGFLKMDNLFDQRYYSAVYDADFEDKDPVYMYGLPANPFRLMGGVRWQF